MSNTSAEDAPGSPATIKPDAEKSIVTYTVIVAVFLAALPCILGFASSGPLKTFVGAVYNVDDSLVYYSWTRQAADGHFFIRNLFTTDHQIPIQFNLLISLLGAIVKLTNIPIPVLFFVGRLIAAAGLLFLIYRLYRFLVPNDPLARVTGLFMAALGSGFGWMYWPAWSDKNHVIVFPIDTWQPEALTFQSIETSMLFAISQILIIAVIFFLALGQRTGKMRYAVLAGLSSLLLGNIHSYDIIHLAAAWLVYLIVINVIERRFDSKTWLQALVCFVIGLPSPLYQYHMFLTDPVWHKRVYDLTLSPPMRYYFLGWGLVFLLAVAASVLLYAKRPVAVQQFTDDKRGLILPVCWFLGALAVSYLPHANFQRKMIMGADIPLSLLAGCGISLLTAKMRTIPRIAVAMLLCVATLPTSILWLTRDCRHVIYDKSETLTPPFISPGEVSAFDWIRQNTTPDSAFLGPPSMMIFVPGWCDRYTYASQWGETPNYTKRVGEVNTFLLDGMPEDERAQFLQTAKVDYLVEPNDLAGQSVTSPSGVAHLYADFSRMPDLFQPVYSNAELTIYKVLIPHA